MNDPKRWLDGGGGTGESLDLLRVARGTLPLSETLRRRSRLRLAAMSGLPVAAAFGGWSALALGAVLGATGAFAVSHALVPRSTAPVLVAPSTNTQSVEPPPLASAAGRKSSAADALPKVQPSAEPTALRATALSSQGLRDVAQGDGTIDQLHQELALLERARNALSLAPGTARLALLEHERMFPSGVLRVERELLMVDALVRLGRRSEAEARAAALEFDSPKNLYGERLDQILGRAPH